MARSTLVVDAIGSPILKLHKHGFLKIRKTIEANLRESLDAHLIVDNYGAQDAQNQELVARAVHPHLRLAA